MTRRLQAGEAFTWVLPVHQKTCGTGESTACCGGSQRACSVTLGSTPARDESPLPPVSMFFSAHLFLLALTASLIPSRSRTSGFPSHIRRDPAPSISSSPLSLLLPLQSGTCPTDELGSCAQVVRTCLQVPLESGLLTTVGDL